MDSSSNDSLMIIDIDEVLKDDSFIHPNSCFFEEKTHDDISNIIQQWKTNNVLPTSYMSQTDVVQQQDISSSITNAQPEQPLQHIPYGNVNSNENLNRNGNGNGSGTIADDDVAFKLNTKTFTRPRRKSVQQCEQHFNTGSHNATTTFYNQAQQRNKQMQHMATTSNGSSGVNMQIGGLVTTMQKSFLQDTSPPASICSSMESSSIDRMNNSLITSADFSNINFLQSTNSLGEKIAYAGYTFEDMISDRKALESLTMSGDGTLIKDSNIAQIDDISMTFSKTASGCSTMNNSTESVEGINFINTEQLPERPRILAAAYAGHERARRNYKTIQLTNEMINDVTFNLVDSTISDTNLIISPDVDSTLLQNNVDNQLNITHTLNMESKTLLNETFKKPLPLNETVCFISKTNTTHDAQPSTPDNKICNTPEGMNTNKMFLESTPVTHSSINYDRKQKYTNDEYKTIIINNEHDVPISPIASTHNNNNNNNNTNNKLKNIIHSLDNTFENYNKYINECSLNDSSLKIDTDKDKDQDNEKYAKQCKTYRKEFSDFKHSPNIEMENVMNLAEAEARLLVVNDDEHEFELMLNEFSKIEMNPEQVKMKKSLETIKKRFTVGTQNAQNNKSHDNIIDDNNELDDKIKLQDNKLYKNNDLIEDNQKIMNESSFSANFNSNSASGSVSSSGSSSERLLNRRSRLYDNLNLSTTMSTALEPKMSTTTYIINQSNIGNFNDHQQQQYQENEFHNKTETVQMNGASNKLDNDITDIEQYKLTEKRHRDRDRFKTIKIDKQRDGLNDDNCDSQKRMELNVPCIDGLNDINSQIDFNSLAITINDDDDVNADYKTTNSILNNNNKLDLTNDDDKAYTNYLTYRKPNRPTNLDLPEIMPFDNVLEPTIEMNLQSSSPLSTPLPPELQESPEMINKSNNSIRATPPMTRRSNLANFESNNYRKSPGIQNAGIPTNKLIKPIAVRPIQTSTTITTAATTALSSINTNNTQFLQPAPPSMSAIPKRRNFESQLMRPRYTSGLPKLNYGFKAQSADGLEQSTTLSSSSMEDVQKVMNGQDANSIQKSNNITLNSYKTTSKPQSPMGIKSKSFHNLADNKIEHAKNHNDDTDRIKNDSKRISNPLKTQTNFRGNPLNVTNNGQNQEATTSKLVSGLRNPNSAGNALAKRSGLQRPSSGYFSLNPSKLPGQIQSDTNTNMNRQSMVEPMTSSLSHVMNENISKHELKSSKTFTKITNGPSEQNPKPSGLKPPTNFKRSALPRPSTITKR